MNHRDQSTAISPLRLLTVLAWVPAFALGLPHGLTSHYPCPAIGILPMSISACIGIVHLSRKAKHRGANIAMDIFCACFLISILIPSYIMFTYHDFSRDANLKVLGTYATVPMMMNFAIHSWFVLRELKWRGIFRKDTCPHCRGDLSRSGRLTHGYSQVSCDETPTQSDQKEASSPNDTVYHDEDGGPPSFHDPRPSTDDETARLV